eukprot:1762642-Rhodomonas_salina.1
MSGTALAHGTICLRACYAMCDTGYAMCAYGATRDRQRAAKERGGEEGGREGGREREGGGEGGRESDGSEGRGGGGGGRIRFRGGRRRGRARGGGGGEGEGGEGGKLQGSTYPPTRAIRRVRTDFRSCAVRCPVLTYSRCTTVLDAVSGTAMGYAPTRLLCDVQY